MALAKCKFWRLRTPKPPLATQISMLHVLHWPHRSACSNARDTRIHPPPTARRACCLCSAPLLLSSAAQLLSLSTVDVIVVLLGAKDPDPADDHHPAHPTHRGRWNLQGKRITLGRLPLYRGYHSWPPVWLYRGYARAMSELLLW